MHKVSDPGGFSSVRSNEKFGEVPDPVSHYDICFVNDSVVESAQHDRVV